MTAAPLAKLIPRNVWDIADDALDLYRARFFPLCGLAALFLGVPLTVYLWLISGPLRAVLLSVMSGDRGGAAPLAAAGNLTAASLLATPIFLMGRALLDAPIAVIVGEYLTTGAYITMGEAIRRSLRFIGPMIGIALISAVTVTAAASVIGVLALFITALWAFVGPIVVWEGKRLIAALKRALSLNRNAFFKAVGMIALMGIFPGFLALSFLVLLVLGFAMIPLGGDPTQEYTRRFIIGFALLMVASVVMMPLEAIARTLLYFDIRVRREGLDVVSQAIEQDYPLMDDPFGDMTSEEARQRQLKATRRP